MIGKAPEHSSAAKLWVLLQPLETGVPRDSARLPGRLFRSAYPGGVDTSFSAGRSAHANVEEKKTDLKNKCE